MLLREKCSQLTYICFQVFPRFSICSFASPRDSRVHFVIILSWLRSIAFRVASVIHFHSILFLFLAQWAIAVSFVRFFMSSHTSSSFDVISSQQAIRTENLFCTSTLNPSEIASKSKSILAFPLSAACRAYFSTLFVKVNGRYRDLFLASMRVIHLHHRCLIKIFCTEKNWFTCSSIRRGSGV